MNLYQASYTRRGKQGEGSGWSIVAPSEEMSRDAMDGFSGIAARLADLAGRLSMPREAFGIFRYDRFLYYMNINYHASGGDARGVSFTHGYCFGLADYYELCRTPEQLFGVKEETFRREYDPEVKALPEVHELGHETMDAAALMEKYGLTAESYRRLLIGATCAVEGDAGALCVRTERPLEEYGQVCREVMYLIMRGLPYHLRTRLTFFSYKGRKVDVYFSDKAEGENYFDLDTKEYACDKRALERYRFTQIYSLEDDALRQRLLMAMASFIDEAFDVPLKDVDCYQVEHAFQSQLKNLSGEAIDKDLAIPLLGSFLSAPLKESGAVEEYLADILESISENDLRIGDFRLSDQLANRARNSANLALRDGYRSYRARQILAAGEPGGFAQLWEQYKKDGKEYRDLTDLVSQMDPGYYGRYYETVFLPQSLQSLQEIRAYLKEEGEMLRSQKLFEIFLTQLQDVTRREMRDSAGFEGHRAVRGRAGKIAGLMDSLKLEGTERYLRMTDYLLWEEFEISQFSEQDIRGYMECGLEEIAEKGFEGEPCEKAEKVVALVKLVKVDMLLEGKEIHKLAFTDDIFDDVATKKIMQNIVRNRRKGKRRSDSMDLQLFCYYDFDKKRLEAAKWIRKSLNLSGDLFTPEKLPVALERSYLLAKDDKLKKRIINSLKDELEEKAWRSGDRREDKEVQQAMELFLACLRGEKLDAGDSSGDGDGGEGQEFVFCLHKLAVGYLAVLSIAFFVWCVWKYAEMGIWALIIGIVAVLGTLVMIAASVWQEGGIGEYFNSRGITSGGKLGILLGGGAVLSALGFLLWGLAHWLPALQKGGSLKVIVAAGGCGIFVLLAVAGIVAVALQEEE